MTLFKYIPLLQESRERVRPAVGHLTSTPRGLAESRKQQERTSPSMNNHIQDREQETPTCCKVGNKNLLLTFRKVRHTRMKSARMRYRRESRNQGVR